MARTDDLTDMGFSAGALSEAVEACRRQDRRLDMYYKFASPTARKFIELGFYSTHFGEQTDPVLYARCRDAIAPSLTENDLRYLLRFESDAGTKAYLNGLLGKLLEAPAPLPVPAESPKPVESPKPAAPSGKRRRGKKPLRIVRIRTASAGAGNGSFWTKVLFVLAAVCLIAIVGAIRAWQNDLREQEALRRRLSERSLREAKPVTQPPADERRAASGGLPPRPPETVAASREDASEMPAESPPDEVPDEGSDAPETAAADMSKTRHVLLTDGIRIRTRPDGTIEVPRTFSYAGAGLKKPFWIYDRTLEKSGRIEHEARALKKARDRWKALYDEAVRQEATSSSRGSRP